MYLSRFIVLLGLGSLLSSLIAVAEPEKPWYLQGKECFEQTLRVKGGHDYVLELHDYLIELMELEESVIKDIAQLVLSKSEYEKILITIETTSPFKLVEICSPYEVEVVNGIKITKVDNAQLFTLLLAYRKFVRAASSQSGSHFLLSLAGLKYFKVLHFFNIIGPLLANNEQLLISKGKTPFYHSVQSEIVFAMDMYTQAWSVCSGIPVDNFLFFRFENFSKGADYLKRKRNDKEQVRRNLIQHKGRTDSYAMNESCKERKNLVFLNALLFGNVSNLGSCSAYYFAEACNVNPPCLIAEKIAGKLGMKQLFLKYKSEFEKLQEMHKKLANDKGVMLQLALTDKALQERVFLAQPGGYPKKLSTVGGEEVDDVKALTQILQANIGLLDQYDRDVFEFCMIASNLEPGMGVEVEAFYDADSTQQLAYKKCRDELFAKIKKDYEQMVKTVNVIRC